MVELHRLVFFLAVIPFPNPEHLRLALQAVLTSPLPISPAEPVASGNNALLMMVAAFISQLKVSGFVATAIQLMKKAESPAFGWISKNTPWVTRLVATAAAGLTTLGIHWTFTSGTLTVTGLSLAVIVGAVYNVAQTYLFQHAWFRLIFSAPPAMPAQAPVVGSAPIAS